MITYNIWRRHNLKYNEMIIDQGDKRIVLHFPAALSSPAAAEDAAAGTL